MYVYLFIVKLHKRLRHCIKQLRYHNGSMKTSLIYNKPSMLLCTQHYLRLVIPPPKMSSTETTQVMTGLMTHVNILYNLPT